MGTMVKVQILRAPCNVKKIQVPIGTCWEYQTFWEKLWYSLV